jgi:hypothetical protein
LRCAAGVTAFFEKAKKLGVKARSEPRIGLAGGGAAELQGKSEPPEKRANPIEAENDEEENECGREKDAEQRMLFLPSGERTDRVIGKLAMPVVSEAAPIAGSAMNVLRKKRLVREVVVDDPLIPIELDPVQVHAEAGEEAGAGVLSRGRGIKGDPATARKVGLDPAVGVTGANDIVAADIVEFTGKEAVDFAGRNAQGAKHDGHRRSKIFAVPGTRLKEEMSKGVLAGSAGEIQGVGEIAAEVILESDGTVIGIVLRASDLPGQFGNARIE